MKTPQEGTFPEPGHPVVTECAQEDCPAVHEVLARVGDKWSVLVIMRLGRGSLRFNELKRTVDGISQRMLTLTLRGLERDGLVSRKVTASIPPRVDYALTALGRDLLKPVAGLGKWAVENRTTIQAARAHFDSAGKGLDSA